MISERMAAACGDWRRLERESLSLSLFVSLCILLCLFNFGAGLEILENDDRWNTNWRNGTETESLLFSLLSFCNEKPKRNNATNTPLNDFFFLFFFFLLCSVLLITFCFLPSFFSPFLCPFSHSMKRRSFKKSTFICSADNVKAYTKSYKNILNSEPYSARLQAQIKRAQAQVQTKIIIIFFVKKSTVSLCSGTRYHCSKGPSNITFFLSLLQKLGPTIKMTRSTKPSAYHTAYHEFSTILSQIWIAAK